MPVWSTTSKSKGNFLVDHARSSGIILHISSLPSRHGIGDLGQSAYQWVDFLDHTGTGIWQVLPLNPTGFGESPYQGLSTFAGNPFFISLDLLVEDGLLKPDDVITSMPLSNRQVNYARMRKYKLQKLGLAFANYQKGTSRSLSEDFQEFESQNRGWLPDYATFMAIRMENKQKSWKDWPLPLGRRLSKDLLRYQRDHAAEISRHAFYQFLFYRQWDGLKGYAAQKMISILGDLPIYLGLDSADVWANPSLFLLDEKLNPTAVAGVPPDFFSASGQLWGNPLYDWEEHRRKGFLWWRKRIKETLKHVDLIRLDHFRGFSGYWQVPAGSESAASGEWKDGPGRALFEAIQSDIPGMPFIAEDLGIITPDVVALRDEFNLPGMKVLQFAFGSDSNNTYLPHHYAAHCAAYTGTHDNEPSSSWFKKLQVRERQFCLNYIGGSANQIAHDMIRAIWRSPAMMAIAPMQDFLQLGKSGRMNLPASINGNWRWRMTPDQLTDELANWIKTINIIYGRVHPGKKWSVLHFFENNGGRI